MYPLPTYSIVNLQLSFLSTSPNRAMTTIAEFKAGVTPDFPGYCAPDTSVCSLQVFVTVVARVKEGIARHDMLEDFSTCVSMWPFQLRSHRSPHRVTQRTLGGQSECCATSAAFAECAEDCFRVLLLGQHSHYDVARSKSGLCRETTFDEVLYIRNCFFSIPPILCQMIAYRAAREYHFFSSIAPKTTARI